MVGGGGWGVIINVRLSARERSRDVVMQDLDGSLSKVSFSFMHILTYV